MAIIHRRVEGPAVQKCFLVVSLAVTAFLPSVQECTCFLVAGVAATVMTYYMR